VSHVTSESLEQRAVANMSSSTPKHLHTRKSTFTHEELPASIAALLSRERFEVSECVIVVQLSSFSILIRVQRVKH
jgi:hypothetical protein